ncbi:hypothetical protein Cob_v004164 [Colletotrichum orbiculare MAFF 240422]|uniref:Uncharacterized protein n=1 Tax=Colletotrichum orbiculare (strain 104-T / ATCC 96160 / CBS 514.97 / LARS 414 / MAFF 240422) TaxID=1213857 RepID=A0A484FWF4_COLOR|nr:hypothetical protein Cob_v004164 [Colletotrichum orbiculare MAFF 240422]
MRYQLPESSSATTKLALSTQSLLNHSNAQSRPSVVTHPRMHYCDAPGVHPDFGRRQTVVIFYEPSHSFLTAQQRLPLENLGAEASKKSRPFACQ